MLVFAILVSHKVVWESDITHEDFLSGTSVFGSLTERFLYAQKKWHQEHCRECSFTVCNYQLHILQPCKEICTNALITPSAVGDTSMPECIHTRRGTVSRDQLDIHDE